MHKFTHTTVAALFGISVLASTGAVAADKAMASQATVVQPANANTRSADRLALSTALMKGQDAATIRQKLTDMGYKITAVNDLEKDYVEYEVVKGQVSYEVQVDLDPATRKATAVDITSNFWRADSTEAAMKGTAFKTTTSKTYSDRSNMMVWTDEKEKLERALGVGQPIAYYRTKLGQLGYKISAVNDREKDYTEFEVVRGKNSFEVQIDVDQRTGNSTKVDVTSNMWEADGTEKALAR